MAEKTGRRRGRTEKQECYAQQNRCGLTYTPLLKCLLFIRPLKI